MDVFNPWRTVWRGVRLAAANLCGWYAKPFQRGHAPLPGDLFPWWLLIVLLLTVPVAFYEKGIFWGTVASFVAIFLTLLITAALLLHSRAERKERAHVQQLQNNPFNRLRCWVKSVTDGEITSEEVETREPDYSGTGFLDVPVGHYSIYIQTFARIGVAVYGADLRFVGVTNGIPILVGELQDPIHHDREHYRRTDAQGGREVWYLSPRPVSEGRAINYSSSFQANSSWEGDLGLRLELTNGRAPIVRIPCRITSQKDS